MKRRLNLKRFIIFISVVFAISYYAGSRLVRLFQDTPVDVTLAPEPEPVPQGILTVTNYGQETKAPISNSEFHLIDQTTGEVMAVLTTDALGQASSMPLDYDSSYWLVQKQVADPYALSTEKLSIVINGDFQEVMIENALKGHIKGYRITEAGNLEVTTVNFPVETLLQLPELPNGCEITSLSALLNAYGFNADKNQMADHYLRKEAFYREEGQLYGANPYVAYAGNPREKSGFFVYAPPVVDAANQFLTEEESSLRAFDLSGSTQEAILQHLIKEGPVVMWVTLDLSAPRINYSWLLKDTGEPFMAPVNLHAVVLYGFDEENVYVMDPLQGQVIHPIGRFFDSYIALGSHAVGLNSK